MGSYTPRCGQPTNKDGTCCCSYCEGRSDAWDIAEQEFSRLRTELAKTTDLARTSASCAAERARRVTELEAELARVTKERDAARQEAEDWKEFSLGESKHSSSLCRQRDEVERERDEIKAEFDQFREIVAYAVRCAYCDEVMLKDELREHAMTNCPTHPMREVERERDAAILAHASEHLSDKHGDLDDAWSAALREVSPRHADRLIAERGREDG